MADYRTITDAEVDPDAPLTSSLGYAWRDNPIAIAEGATGAPRITQTAIMNPTAGTFRTITSVTTAISSGTESGSRNVVKFSVITPGTLRIRTDTNVSTGSATVTVSRIRNGNNTVISTYDSSGTRNDDVSVQIGDMVRVRVVRPFSASSITCNAQILIGNDALSGVVVEADGM